MYQLPPIPPRKKPRPAYKKPEAVKLLERMADAAVREKYKNVEAKYLSPRKYEDRSSNGLTRCCIDFIRLSGYQAERINCIGKRIDNTKVVTDVLDRKRVIGSTKWLPTSGQKGTADVSAVIRGMAVKIEIKAGNDRQRPDQVEYQKQIEQAGGIYLIVRSFAELYDWYNEFTAVRTAPQNNSEHIDNQDMKNQSVPYMYKNGL